VVANLGRWGFGGVGGGGGGGLTLLGRGLGRVPYTRFDGQRYNDRGDSYPVGSGGEGRRGEGGAVDRTDSLQDVAKTHKLQQGWPEERRGADGREGGCKEEESQQEQWKQQQQQQQQQISSSRSSAAAGARVIARDSEHPRVCTNT
jgi:hypothetical protein